MEKGTVSKKVNEDFIPVVHLNGSNLEYTEIIIEKKYEYLISLIKKALKNTKKPLKNRPQKCLLNPLSHNPAET